MEQKRMPTERRYGGARCRRMSIEIDVTPKMVQAGITELYSWTDGDNSVSAECMAAVYRAMSRACAQSV
jgi:hypothetical protein